MASTLPTPLLEAKVRQRGLSWQEICETIVELHARYIADGTSETYKQTATRLGFYDGSVISKYHRVYEFWAFPEVREARTVVAALAAANKHLDAKRSQAAKTWRGQAYYGPSPEASLKRKLNEIFKKAPNANN
jgi:hypothetical protein